MLGVMYPLVHVSKMILVIIQLKICDGWEGCSVCLRYGGTHFSDG